MRNFAPAIVRIGVALVLLWFGWQQLTNPSAWVGLIPSWATDISGLPANTLVTINGTAEIIIGSLLFLGLFTKLVAFISALHLALITYVVGYNGIGVRDFGLTMAAFSTFLYGVDSLCLDRFWRGKF